MSGKQRDLSTPWSDWIWSPEHGQSYATRKGPTGEVEYDWLDPSEDPRPRYKGEWPSNNTPDPITSSPTGQAVYTTSAPPTSSHTTTGVKTTSHMLPKEFQRTTSGPSTSSGDVNNLAPALQGASIQDDLTEIQFRAPSGQLKLARQIKTSHSNNTELDGRYVEMDERKHKKFWKKGRVFMMLWTEPARLRGPRGTQHSVVWLGETVYSEIRRFVIIGEGHGNVICSPIHTYGGQATLKENLPDPQQHAVIYTSTKPPGPLTMYDSENNIVAQEQLVKDPIRVIRELDDEDGDLGKCSRINYAKIYTVEKYVRILNIGRVHEDSMESLLNDCFFARPEDQPVQGPRNKHKARETRDTNERRGDTGQSSKNHRSRR